TDRRTHRHRRRERERQRNGQINRPKERSITGYRQSMVAPPSLLPEHQYSLTYTHTAYTHIHIHTLHELACTYLLTRSHACYVLMCTHIRIRMHIHMCTCMKARSLIHVIHT
ncbi:hypothetical protein WUBG_13206, partial [Wuchereria bancrofti]